MPNYFVQPIEMVSAPNFFSPAPAGEGFSVTEGSPTSLWFILMIDDNLGKRRFIPATGATLQLTFMRADNITFNIPTPARTTQSVIKIATQDASDKSLYKVDLTATDTQNVRSGSIKFTLTASGSSTSWTQHYLLERKSTAPGC